MENIFYCYGLIHGVIFGIAWSLEVEIQFYLLVPLLTLAFKLKNSVARRACFLAAILAIGVVQQLAILGPHAVAGSARLGITILFYLQYFLAGLLLSDLYLLELPKWRPSWWWDGISLVAWPAIFFLEIPWWHAVLPLFIIPAYLAAFRAKAVKRFFSNYWIAVIGGMCYSIYLWHFFVIAFVMRASRHLLIFHDFLINYTIQVIAMVPVVLAVSGVYFIFVERPCMDPDWPAQLRFFLTGKQVKVEAVK
jgi:peptidoglycan/LPS O-acetylase OafA/YrhL